MKEKQERGSLQEKGCFYMKQLIKNKEASRWTTSKDEFCNECGNRGIIETPDENDKDKFEYLLDKYEDMGYYSSDECYHKALKRVKTKKVYCQYCEKGLNFKDRYPKNDEK